VGYSEEGQETPRVSIDQLPSGEQQVLLLFGELARQRRQGVVIAIDEVENSLHPTMQRLVMWNLRRLAKDWNSQIIVATHSLEVINSVRGGAFINLDYPESHFDLPVWDEDSQVNQ
jgi:predicted ATPase